MSKVQNEMIKTYRKCLNNGQSFSQACALFMHEKMVVESGLAPDSEISVGLIKKKLQI